MTSKHGLDKKSTRSEIDSLARFFESVSLFDLKQDQIFETDESRRRKDEFVAAMYRSYGLDGILSGYETFDRISLSERRDLEERIRLGVLVVASGPDAGKEWDEHHPSFGVMRTGPDTPFVTDEGLPSASAGSDRLVSMFTPDVRTGFLDLCDQRDGVARRVSALRTYLSELRGSEAPSSEISSVADQLSTAVFELDSLTAKRNSDYVEFGIEALAIRAILTNYIEFNLYRKELFAKSATGIPEEDLQLRLRILTADDFEPVSWRKGILSREAEILALSKISESREYFLSCLWHPGMMDNVQIFVKVSGSRNDQLVDTKVNLYRGFVRMFIIWQSTLSCINERMAWSMTAELMRAWDLDNILVSFGVTDMFDLPLSFKRRLVSVINRITKSKGTPEAISLICWVFDVLGASINRFLLTKDFVGREEGELPQGDEPIALRFYRVPADASMIDGHLSAGKTETFEELVSDDPFWVASETEIAGKFGNILETKYISVETSVDVAKRSMEFSFLWSAILASRPSQESLERFMVWVPEYSARSIRLDHAMAAITSMVLRAGGSEDTIPRNPSDVFYVLNHRAFTEDFWQSHSRDFFATYVRPFFPDGISINAMQPFETQGRTKVLSGVAIARSYTNSLLFLRRLSEGMTNARNEGRSEDYAALLKVRKAATLSNSIWEVFPPSAKTYMDVLWSEDPTLAQWCAVDNPELMRRAITLTEAIDVFLENTGFMESGAVSTNAPYLQDYLLRKLVSLIRTFKAYTVDFAYIVNRMLVSDIEDDRIRMTDRYREVRSRIRFADWIPFGESGGKEGPPWILSSSVAPLAISSSGSFVYADPTLMKPNERID